MEGDGPVRSPLNGIRADVIGFHGDRKRLGNAQGVAQLNRSRGVGVRERL